MGNGNKVEMFIAVCALVSSMIAIYVGWDQGRIMRAQQHGSVFPVLQIEGFGANTPTLSDLGLRVRNSGVGPALVESVTLEIDGKVVDNFSSPLDMLPSPVNVTRVGLTGRAIAPGEAVVPVEMAWTRDQVTVEEMTDFAISTQTWELKICYCSVFEKCWETSGFGTERAKSVPACERKESDLFLSYVPRSTGLTSAPALPEQPSDDGATQ